MPGSENIYKATTEPVRSPSSLGYEQHVPEGYLARSLERRRGFPFCCGSKRSKNYCLLITALLSFVGASVLVVTAAVAAGGGKALFITLVTFLYICSALSILIYCRNTGRIDLPCWPSRARRISRTLIGEPGGHPPRCGTQMTIAEEESGNVLNRDERIKLMESDNLEAEKIAQSEPKIEFLDSRQ